MADTRSVFDECILIHAAPVLEIVPVTVDLFFSDSHLSVLIGIVKCTSCRCFEKGAAVHAAPASEIIPGSILQQPAGRHLSIRINMINIIFMRQKGVLCHAAPASEVIPDPVNLFEPGCHFSIRINIIRILVILKKTIPVHRALIIKIIIHIIDQFPAGRHFSVRIRIIRYIFHGVKGIPVNTAPASEIIPGSIKFFPADRHFSVIIQVVTVLVVLSPGSFDNGTIRILKIPDPVLIHPWVIASSLHGYRRLFGLSALYFCRRKIRGGIFRCRIRRLRFCHLRRIFVCGFRLRCFFCFFLCRLCSVPAPNTFAALTAVVTQAAASTPLITLFFIIYSSLPAKTGKACCVLCLF